MSTAENKTAGMRGVGRKPGQTRAAPAAKFG
jgi:hypothetical protein